LLVFAEFFDALLIKISLSSVGGQQLLWKSRKI
jgi:hypothetical protein